MMIEMVPVGVYKTEKGELRYSSDFRAMLGERELCCSSHPFFDSAAVLLADGEPPETVLEARHAGSAIVAMRATLADARLLAARAGVRGDEG